MNILKIENEIVNSALTEVMARRLKNDMFVPLEAQKCLLPELEVLNNLIGEVEENEEDINDFNREVHRVLRTKCQERLEKNTDLSKDVVLQKQNFLALIKKWKNVATHNTDVIIKIINMSMRLCHYKIEKFKMCEDDTKINKVKVQTLNKKITALSLGTYMKIYNEESHIPRAYMKLLDLLIQLYKVLKNKKLELNSKKASYLGIIDNQEYKMLLNKYLLVKNEIDNINSIMF